MILCDVNVLVYAHKEGADRHKEYLAWLTEALDDEAPFGVSDLVLSSVLRLVTNRRMFDPPTPLADALRFVEAVRSHANAIPVRPGPRHWDIFRGLCERANASANLVPDAYLAALAIESGCELITTDRDFIRFPGLRWRHPLDALGTA